MFSHMSVILSMGRAGLCMMSLPVWLPEGSLSGGILCPEGSLSGGISVQEGFCLGGLCPGWGLCQGDPPCSVKSGQYASYWNAFLFN